MLWNYMPELDVVWCNARLLSEMMLLITMRTILMRVVCMAVMLLMANCVRAVAANGDADVTVLKSEQRLNIEFDTLAMGYSFETKVAISGNRDSNGLGKAMWRLEWLNGEGKAVRTLQLRWGNELLGDPTDRRYLRVDVDSIDALGKRILLAEKCIYEGTDMYGGYNVLSIEDDGDAMNVWVGNDLEYFVCKVPSAKSARMIALWGNRKLKVDYTTYMPHEDRCASLSTGWTKDELLVYLTGPTSGLEGLWRFLDRDTNAKWAEPGGRYVLAVVKCDVAGRGKVKACEGYFANQQPLYDIIYLDGGVVNASKWRAGMLKGRLYSTIFENHYTLVWFDADMEIIAEEISADVIDRVILSLNFPLLHSTLRFAKER